MLTPEQIDALPAGPEMDAAVTEALGWHSNNEIGFPMWVDNAGVPQMSVTWWHPSADMNDALVVMRSCFYVCVAYNSERQNWTATVFLSARSGGDSLFRGGQANTAPLAICRAFLIAMAAQP